MTSTRIDSLEKAIAAEIAPFLKQAGFAYDRKRRTFRRQVGACTQIVNFQVGTRSMEGQFAVNLGIYHPIYREDPGSETPDVPEEFHCLVRERLSMLRDTVITKLFRSVVAQKDTSFKWWLTTPTDYWWRFSAVPGEVSESLAHILKLLQSKGFHWLEEKSNEKLLRQIHEEQQRRVGKI